MRFVLVFLAASFHTAWAYKCIEFTEISKKYRSVNPKYSFYSTCGLDKQVCRAARFTNGTHYVIVQGCVDSSFTVFECSKNKQKNFFHCWDSKAKDMGLDRTKSSNGRACCCSGDFCNRIDNVISFESLIPFEAILSKEGRGVYTFYYSVCVASSFFGATALAVVVVNVVIGCIAPSDVVDDAAWHEENRPVLANQASFSDEDSDDEDSMGTEEEKSEKGKARVVVKQNADGTLRMRKRLTKRRAFSETTQETQDETVRDLSVPSILEERDEGKAKGRKRKSGAVADEKDEAAPLFTLPKGPKMLKNGRMQYVSMINENSSYSDDD